MNPLESKSEQEGSEAVSLTSKDVLTSVNEPMSSARGLEHKESSQRLPELSPYPVAKWRDRLAMILLLLAAAGALYSCLAAFSSIALASPALQMVESWRMYGFLVFGGLFVLLAFWPRHYPGIWELVIFHKAAMAITAATLIASGAPGAQTIALVDGTLAAITLAAYILTKGYTGWARLRVYTLSTRKS